MLPYMFRKLNLGPLVGTRTWGGLVATGGMLLIDGGMLTAPRPAFLNTDGGVLLVGVGDDCSILGTDADRFESDDKYLLHVNNRIQQHVGLEYASFIRFQLVSVETKKVLLIKCQPSPS